MCSDHLQCWDLFLNPGLCAQVFAERSGVTGRSAGPAVVFGFLVARSHARPRLEPLIWLRERR